MPSTENTVIVAFGATALVLAYAVPVLTDLPTWVGVGVVILVGVVLPWLVIASLERVE